MSMAAITHNLFIEQGATCDRTLLFNWGIKARCDATGTSTQPVTRLEIEPIPEVIPVGYELYFSCKQRLIVSAIAPVGQKFVLVQPYVGTVRAGSECDGVPIDMTGTYQASIRSAYDGEVLATPVVTGGAGSLVLNIPYGVTETIPHNLRRDQIPDGIPFDLVQSPELLGEALYKKGYPYQVERTVGANRTRVLEGLAFVAQEVVRV